MSPSKHRYKSKSRVWIKPLYIFIVIFIFSLISLWGVLRYFTQPLTHISTNPISFTVHKGDSVSTIATNLASAHIIKSPLGFRYIVRLHHLDAKLQAGIYSLSPNSSVLEIANQLTTGIADIIVTIPEGYRLEQVAELIQSKLNIPTTEFLSLAKDMEGYLFPDTYYFSPTTSASQVVELMRQTFNSKVGNIDSSTLILASLIERETKTRAEKRIVAGILTNRLKAKWPLELDATIQYALGKQANWWPQTNLKDRQVNSLYNTYKHQGLPPTPICNPGLDSIRAAQNPQSTDYWFYLHDKNGIIRYATTNAQHSANIIKYIR